jgi:hypothetical protein
MQANFLKAQQGIIPFKGSLLIGGYILSGYVLDGYVE